METASRGGNDRRWGQTLRKKPVLGEIFSRTGEVLEYFLQAKGKEPGERPRQGVTNWWRCWWVRGWIWQWEVKHSIWMIYVMTVEGFLFQKYIPSYMLFVWWEGNTPPLKSCDLCPLLLILGGPLTASIIWYCLDQYNTSMVKQKNNCQNLQCY